MEWVCIRLKSSFKDSFFIVDCTRKCPNSPYIALTLGQIRTKRAELGQNCYTLHVRNVNRRVIPSLENSSNFLYDGTHYSTFVGVVWYKYVKPRASQLDWYERKDYHVSLCRRRTSLFFPGDVDSSGNFGKAYLPNVR